MILTKEHLRAISPFANDKLITALAPAMMHWLPIYGITNKHAVWMFLGEGAEETDGFKTLEEYASGAAYEGRKDLGNIHPGDGVKDKGRGIFMTTGATNYAAEAKELGIDLVNHPELLLIADNAVHAACAYWQDRNMGPAALVDDIVIDTRKVNGGLNGLAARRTYWGRAKLVVTEDLDIPAHVIALGAVQPRDPPRLVPLAASPAALPPAKAQPPIPIEKSSVTPLKPPASGLWAWLLSLFKPAPVGNRQNPILGGNSMFDPKTLFSSISLASVGVFIGSAIHAVVAASSGGPISATTIITGVASAALALVASVVHTNVSATTLKTIADDTPVVAAFATSVFPQFAAEIALVKGAIAELTAATTANTTATAASATAVTANTTVTAANTTVTAATAASGA